MLHLLVSFFLLCTLAIADVTIIPTTITEPKPYAGQEPAISAHDLLTSSASSVLRAKDASILLSSMSALNRTANLRASSDSFVRGAVEAWAGHQHLIIRPEAVWFSILAQMNFYMTAHADDESVRSTFVSFDGKQDIRIEGHSLASILPRFQIEIQRRVKTAWLLDWIQPNFTTSTADDGMAANILMMGLMKGYFNYIASIVCGIPSITLVGAEADWVRLEAKLARLSAFGAEPAAYAENLKPVLSRFVRSFKAPDDPAIRQFWQDVVTATPRGRICGESPYHVNGWINAFHYWDTQGKVLPPANDRAEAVELDGVKYPWRDIKYFPTAFATVPLKIEDNGRNYNATALAGMVGKKIERRLIPGYAGALQRIGKSTSNDMGKQDHWTMEPVPGWFVYTEEEKKQQQQEGPADMNIWRRRESWPGLSCISESGFSSGGIPLGNQPL
jgi:hypothetical protein